MHRAKAVQVLSGEKVTKFLAKEEITSQNAQDVIALNAALQKLTAVCGRQFPKNGPNLATLNQVVANLVKATEGQQKENSKLQTTASDQQPPVSAQQQDTGSRPQTTIEQQPSTDAQPTPTAPAGEQKPPELEIPGEVAKLLEPISSRQPAGNDLANPSETDYIELKDAISNYLELKSEIGKVKPNYDRCITLASDLLQNETKDIDVMLALCFAWYRKEGVVGLKNGLLLLLKALQQFGNGLYPTDPARRGKAFNFLNTKQLATMLAKVRVEQANAKAVLDLNEVFHQFQREFLQQFMSGVQPHKRPSFIKGMEEALKSHVEEANKLLKPPEKEPEPLVTPLPETPDKQKTPGTTAKSPSPASGVTSTTIASDKDALTAMKKALVF
ncbi:MAG: type VI secretion system ImpA family N-terminal domain-containing protein, partial [bacterium]